MRLDEQGLQNRQAWEAAGYELPGFDREQMIAKTKEAPSGCISERAIFSRHFWQMWYRSF